MSWIAGVDVGGTFTDVVLYNPKTREIRIRKVPTTPANQAEGFLHGIADMVPLAEVDAIVHGTTVGTNALLERKGAKTGLIASDGFRDLIEIGRRTRPHDFGMTGEFQPLIPRDLRIGVRERVDAHGRVIVPLDRDDVLKAAKAFAAAGVESIAIMFMHSYANPEPELAAKRIVESVWPNDYLSLSHEVLPEVGEFERVSTTAVNAYLQPLIHRYVQRVDDELRRAGFTKVFRIMQSNGGALNVVNAARNACRSVLSGPAGGAIAATWIGRQIGSDHVISADMGGTSFDVAIVLGGEPMLAEEKDFDYGIPSRIPMIDIETIGAGGGSLIYRDEAGILHVGPRSAGAVPGPICYGRGGTQATVTDANFHLGRIDIGRFLPEAGDHRAAVQAAFARLGKELGTTADGAAEAAIRIIDLNMAGAIRKISLEKGMDTRKFVLVPFGGAGPLHACSIADNLFIPRVLVPAWPGVTSALGCLLADIRYDDTWTVHRRTDQIEASFVRDLFAQMVERVMAVMREDDVVASKVKLRYEAAMQYEGQAHRLTITLPGPDMSGEALAKQFQKDYLALNGVIVNDVPIRLVNLRLRATAPRDVEVKVDATHPSGSGKPRRQSRMMFGSTWYDAAIWERDDMRQTTVVAGPARIDQADTTTVVPPGWVARLDQFGNIDIHKEG
ncbi:MAG: hydantoinase/oxoprolinase family protein [Alphaproteobacteria bacterium]